jgi:alpha-L-rhamnosidase
MLKILDLVWDGRIAPIGISSAIPLLSWKLESDRPDTLQKSYAICVTNGASVHWDSGTIENSESIHIPYGGAELLAHREYCFSVTVTDNYGQIATAESRFFTGKLNDPWQGKWIWTGRQNDKKNSLPPELFQKTVAVQEKPVRAVLYASAMGIYEAELNGAKIGDSFFTPGYTHYQSYLQFQTYDVTDLMRAGENDLRIMVANGWYLGTIGNKNKIYGAHRGLIAELHLWYKDGSHTILATDESWRQTVDTPLRYADFYNGQTIDGTWADELTWRWEPARELAEQFSELKPHFGAFVREDQRLVPVSLHTTNGGMVYDFGQNHAGVLRVVVDAPRGTTITIRHSEILTEDGSLFTKNLRKAKQQLTLVCGKDGVQEFLPRFTFMGFRYVEVKTDRSVKILEVESIVLTSDAKKTGEFSCSDPLLTRLQQNIQWGQRSNFIEIPTDCPQRDERMGWTGDIAVFASAAAFNRDIGAFMRKWLYDMRLDQRKNGTLPVTVPEIKTYAPTPFHIPIAIWGDAATMVPWAVYLACGDKQFLSSQYDSMKRYTEAERRAAAACGFGKARYLWNHNLFQYGDWCAAGESVGQWKRKGKYLATAFFANSVDIMRKAAKALGRTGDEQEYAHLLEEIRNAFSELCCRDDGTLKGDFQSNYVCALYFGLISAEKKPAVAKRLVELVRQKDHCVVTGFAGTPYIAFALADNGYLEDAYKLLQNSKCPGWIYTVKAGGTTIWERWDALDENGHIQKMGKQSITDMVSFNHYAYGAVGDFFYRRILGIEPVEAGYKHFVIRPVPGGTLTHAEGSLDTVYGKIESHWKNENSKFVLKVTIPANTHCTIMLPNGEQFEAGGGSYQYELNEGGY